MATSNETYVEATGRRKTSVARVRITKSSKRTLTVNNKPLEEYFPTATLQQSVLAPFITDGADRLYSVSVKVSGGGIASQAIAIRHGIARAMVKSESGIRGEMKTKGFLTRDSREKERRKFGLKKARRAPQWSKR